MALEEEKTLENKKKELRTAFARFCNLMQRAFAEEDQNTFKLERITKTLHKLSEEIENEWN